MKNNQRGMDKTTQPDPTKDIYGHLMMKNDICMQVLTSIQADNLDLAEVNTGLDLDLDRTAGDLLVSEEHSHGVHAGVNGLVLDPKCAVLVVNGVDRHVTAVTVC